MKIVGWVLIACACYGFITVGMLVGSTHGIENEIDVLARAGLAVAFLIGGIGMLRASRRRPSEPPVPPDLPA